MRLEDQVCGLEHAKKLLTLGVKQNSVFVWEYYDDQCYAIKYIPYAVVPTKTNGFQLYSAFTVAELGNILPRFDQEEKRLQFGWSIQNDGKKITTLYKCYYKNPDDEYIDCMSFDDENEANSRAKILIYLLERNYISIDEINKKLEC